MKSKVNRQKLQEKLDKLRSVGQGGSSKLWTPKPGIYTIRALEYPHFSKEYEDDIIPEFWFHYNITKGSTVCLEKNFGERCPVCEAVEKMREPAREDKDIWRQMVNIQASPQAFLPVLVRDETETDGTPMVKLWRISKTVHAEIIEQILAAEEEEEDNLMNRKNGVDIKVTKIGPTAQKKFGEVNITVKKKQKPIADSEAEIDVIIAKIPKVEEIYARKTEAELDELVTKWAEGATDEEKSSSKEDDDDDEKDKDVDEKLLDNLLNDDKEDDEEDEDEK